jgi:hypothetical protein
LVNEARWKGQVVYACELCGHAYSDLEIAERCEQYCYAHGHPSLKLTQKAVRKPRVQVDPISAE